MSPNGGFFLLLSQAIQCAYQFPNNNPCNEYVLDGSKLAVVDFEKDLGLLISKDLKGKVRVI